uniref:DNA methyltransferase n=1 Tax=Helicobacter bilis TaxID=37372 RepID=UPI0025A9F4DA
MQKAGQKEHNLLQILQERFISLENVRTLAIDYDRELLGFLLENAEFRERFFTRIDSIAVFEKDKFLDFLKLRMLNKSYTAFSNKIGLQLESSFENTSKVVLNFPFKDCILKGGQSRDEKQKIKEIFFNEVLAKSEIDVLFSKKMLHNFELIECQDSKQPTQRNNSSSFSHCERSEAIHKKLDSSVDCHENLACHTEPLGEVSKNTESKLDFSPVSQAQNDETKHEATAKSQNDEKENAGLKECLSTSPSLLIKGNNLLALHSLKKKFANKVKLIYIDPPYNTGNDSFNYNDNFNHSTWLTFMKNRLEIARDFLSDDGVIFISIDEYESHYCKVLMDEIFGRDNFVGDFIRKTKSTTNDSKIGLNYQHEFLLCYAKNKNNVNLLGGQKDLSKYQNPDNDPFGAWVSDNPSAKSGDPKTGYFAVKNPYTGKEDYPPEGRFWLFSQNTIQRHIDEGRICFKKEHKDDERGFIYKRYLKDLKTTKKTFDSLKFVDNAFMNQVGTKEFVKLFGDSAVFKNPKPESLIYEILNHTTNENDLVMDFFAGSGTTLAVAMKMKRQFIGIEQMEYIES